jgi:hypothetical protein
MGRRCSRALEVCRLETDVVARKVRQLGGDLLELVEIARESTGLRG